MFNFSVFLSKTVGTVLKISHSYLKFKTKFYNIKWAMITLSHANSVK